MLVLAWLLFCPDYLAPLQGGKHCNKYIHFWNGILLNSQHLEWYLGSKEEYLKSEKIENPRIFPIPCAFVEVGVGEGEVGKSYIDLSYLCKDLAKLLGLQVWRGKGQRVFGRLYKYGSLIRFWCLLEISQDQSASIVLCNAEPFLKIIIARLNEPNTQTAENLSTWR